MTYEKGISRIVQKSAACLFVMLINLVKWSFLFLFRAEDSMMEFAASKGYVYFGRNISHVWPQSGFIELIKTKKPSILYIMGKDMSEVDSYVGCLEHRYWNYYCKTKGDDKFVETKISGHQVASLQREIERFGLSNGMDMFVEKNGPTSVSFLVKEVMPQAELITQGVDASELFQRKLQ